MLAFLTMAELRGQELIQRPNSTPISTGTIQLQRPFEKLEMVVNTSKTLQAEHDIYRAQVHNDEIVNVRPTSRSQMLIHARRAGITQVDFYGPNDEVKSIQLVVVGDARELESVLSSEFPTASLRIRPIPNAVIITGFVTSGDDVEHIDRIASQYYPTVINRVDVIGVHTVMLHTQVLEVSRTKLRELGIDWQLGVDGGYLSQSVSGLIRSGATGGAAVAAVGNDTFSLGVINDSGSFFSLIRALRQNNLVKVMADPTLVAVDGRPASFNSGGEFPIIVPSGLGQVGIQFREFGTRLDFVSKVRGDGRIWLDVRPTISEIDSSRGVTIGGTSVPGLRSRYVDTSVELRAGQTLALAGLLQNRTETHSIGIPGLADIPYLGALFRINREIQNEVELLITVTPDFAAPMDPCEVPPGGPGLNSGWLTDHELYWKGYMEVPVTSAGTIANPHCPPADRLPISAYQYMNNTPIPPSGTPMMRADAPMAQPLPPAGFAPPTAIPPSAIPTPTFDPNVSNPPVGFPGSSTGPVSEGWRSRPPDGRDLNAPIRTGTSGFSSR